jgi:hypothetical protein
MRHTAEILIAIALAFALGACSTVDFRWWSAKEPTDIEGHPVEGPVAPSPPADRDRDMVGGDHSVIGKPSPIPDIQVILLRQAEHYLALSPDAQNLEFTRVEANHQADPSDLNLIHLALLAALTAPEGPGAYDAVRGELGDWLAQQDKGTNKDDLLPFARIVLHLLEERERLMAQLTSQNEELQHKLDELKAIEQQLRERDSTEIIRTLP